MMLLVLFAGYVLNVAFGQEAIVNCQTTKGPLTIEVRQEWAPRGAARFVELVKDGFYTDIAFFRSVEGFLTQFGISDKPEMEHWHDATIPDDPSLHRGIMKNYVSFAGGGANTRSTQIFIAFEELEFLGNEPWEIPFAVVTGEESEHTLAALYKGYGDIPPYGEGPDQAEIHNQGNKYIRDNFPLTDFVESCEVVVDNMATVQDEGTTDIHLAAADGNVDAVKQILGEDPESLHVRDRNNWQPIHEAIRAGDIVMTTLLVESGADLESVTTDGGSALWWAKRLLTEGHEVIDYLEKMGAPEVAEGEL